MLGPSISDAASGTVTFLDGKAIGGTVYNGSRETDISTQYAADYNNFNGVTRFWGESGTDGAPLCDACGDPANQFRLLLRFLDLPKHIPTGAKVLS
ncbi:hypothetical protein HYH03_003288, partial [Edaphochlamys debaryana]